MGKFSQACIPTQFSEFGHTGTGAARPSPREHGRRSVEDRDKAEAFAKTYANISCQVPNKLQD